MNDGLLGSLKILDFTAQLPGPYATMVLADLGADVIRIESPTRVDPVRILPPFVDDEGQISFGHAYLNRNKKSVALDLKVKDSFTVIERLLEHYDIVIEQFRPGVMERLGLSYETLSAINNSLIYCSLSGYGQTGPLRERAGHDINYLSRAGIMSYSGKKESGPVVMGIQVADIGSGSYNAIVGLLSAVIHRSRTGQGRYIDVSMTDCLYPYHAVSAAKELSGGESAGYETEPLSGGSVYGFYETADGRYLSFGGVEPQFLSSFCETLNLGHLLGESGPEELLAKIFLQPDFVTALKEKIKEKIKEKPLQHWMEVFKTVDACAEPVLTFSEAVASEQAVQRELLVDVPGPGGKMVKQIAHPIKYSGYSPTYERVGAALGGDTRDVLQSLGYSEPEIETMKQKGAFGPIKV
ncbi:MAG: CoA transferase [Firmicutes bacterium]|nr:CoA transferase [Bacillota bacterium]